VAKVKVHDLELQVKRAYAQLQKQPTVILKQCDPSRLQTPILSADRAHTDVLS
jgi:hypothetical protein